MKEPAQRFKMRFPYPELEEAEDGDLQESGTWEEPWIQVLEGSPKPIPYPFEIKLRYSEKGELLCSGFRIGEGSLIGAGTDEIPQVREDGREALIPLGFMSREPSNITRRMLQAIPLGEVLRYIQYVVFEDPSTRYYAERALSQGKLIAPPEGRTAAPGKKGHPDSFYINAARLFVEECGGGSGNNAEAYRRLAKLMWCDDSTARRHVRKGWELRPDLKPEGARTRRINDAWTTEALTQKQRRKPKEGQR